VVMMIIKTSHFNFTLIMIDNFLITKSILPIEHVVKGINEPLFKFNMLCEPHIVNGVVRDYRGKLNNLFLVIRGDNLIISNSILKYYKGNNYENFYYQELNQAVNCLENILGIPLRDSLVKSFEYGVVIPDNNPYQTYSRFGNYKSKQPHWMIKKGQIYGRYFENSSHKIKIYDKNFEVKKRCRLNMDRSLLRVEKVYSKAHFSSLSNFRNNRIVTLDDLCMRKTLELLGQDLIESLCKIELKNVPEKYGDLTTKDLRVWGYMQYPPVRTAMQKLHKEAFKEDRAKYNKIQKEYRQYKHDVFIEEVSFRIEECLAN
jgi:hypothetical protein